MTLDVSCGNALVETASGPCKVELIHRHRSWPTVTVLEIAPLDWVD